MSYQILFQSSKFLIPQLQDDQKQTNRSDSQDKESPKHEAEVVSLEEIQAAEKAWKKDPNALPKVKTPEKVV